MRLFFVFWLNLVLIQALLGADFSQKKIIRQNSDDFNIINLDQSVKSPNVNQQKELFDSSVLIEKKQSIKKDAKLDFALLVGYKNDFSFVFEDQRISARDLSLLFSKNLIKNLNLPLANSASNGLYQTQKILHSFNANSTLANISPYLKQEKNKAKMYAKFNDYLLVLSFEDFYISIRNFFITKSKNAYAKINFKLVSISSGKILKAQNIELNLALKKDNARANLDEIITQMPAMLAQALHDESKGLKVE